MNRYSQLLKTSVPDEPLVRAALGLLEAGFREMALRALADWAKTDIVSDEMFSAVASLQRPSWGMWNGLISALRNARKTTMRSGNAAQRQAVERACVLEHLLTMMDGAVDPELAVSMKPLAELTRSPLGSRLKLGAVLSLPINLRNRVAHDTPTDAAWWAQAAAAIRALLEFHASVDPMALGAMPTEYTSPWFLDVGGQVLSFNGIERDFAVMYVNDAGISMPTPQRTQEILLAFRRLLGKGDEQEKDFKKLLSKLAPEEIKGVMMGDWLVGHPVGEGGFARVHVGRQLSTCRKVGIKILHDGMEPEAVARFQQEAAFLSRFRHPNIVDVFGFGQETWSAPRSFSLAGEPWFELFSKTAPVKTFIALEWIEGRTLDEVFRASVKFPQDKPSLSTLARWFGAAANALSAVHAAGLIHRDIKPLNLMVTTGSLTKDGGMAEGQIKLMDFGIARIQKAERTLVTEAGKALGTPAYMSPEQLRAANTEGEVGPGSDVYSLAATFYELVTCQRLYHHDTATLDEVQTMKMSGRRPVRPKVVVKGLPWEIETILMGGLEPEPADRYRTMAAMERDIHHFLADEPIEYKRPSLLRRTQLVYRRNRVVSNLVAFFMLLAVAGVVAYIQSIHAEQQRTATQRDLAIRHEGIATEQRNLATLREKEARIRLAEVFSGNGQTLLEKGDSAGALLWYARSLTLLPDAPQQERLERLRIGMTFRQMPRPVNLWNYVLQPRQTVYVAALSGDGRFVVTGEAWIKPGSKKLSDAHGATRVLDALTGKLIGKVIEHDSIVTQVQFNHDATRVVTVAGQVVQVFEVGTGQLVIPPVIDKTGVLKAEFSSDGQQLLIAFGEAHRLRIIDLTTGNDRFPELNFELPLAFCSLSADGTRCLAAVRHGDHGSEGTVYIHDTGTGKALTPGVVVPSLWQALFSPDNRAFAVASGENWARVYDAATGQPLTGPLAHSGVVTQIAFSRDGKQIATASADKTARVWDVATGKPVSFTMQHDEAPFALGFNEDGTRLATFSRDKTVRIWDAKMGYPVSPPIRAAGELEDGIFCKDNPDQFVIVTQSGAACWDLGRSADPGALRIEVPGDVTRTAFSQDSTRIVANSSIGVVRIVDAITGKPACPPIQIGQAVHDANLSPDGGLLLTVSKDAARIWKVSTTQRSVQQFATLKHNAEVTSAKFSPNGRWVVTTSADKTARVWDAVTGRMISGPLQHEGVVNDAEFSPDGRAVATASADQTSRVWDAATGSPITPPLNSGSGVPQVHFSPDGTLLLVPDESGHLRLWNALTGTSVARFNFGGATQIACFSPDGNQILAAGFSDFVKLYDTKSPQNPAAILPSGSISTFGTISPTGSIVYTSSFNGSRLWDTSGTPVGPPLLRAPLRHAAFSPDGHWLATVDFSKIRTWDLSPDNHSPAELEKFARLLSSRNLDAKGIVSPLQETESLLLFEELRKGFPDELSGRR